MQSDPWPPIPAHAIEIAGRAMLPERLVDIEGRPYVRCELHGLIPADHRCAESPGDHFCGVSAHPNHTPGDDHDDQCTPHEAWADHLLSRVRAIADVHCKDVDTHGGSSGGCKECGLEWPCLTFHLARGWGDLHDCLDARWCHHVNEPVTPEGAGYVSGFDS